MKLPKLTVKTSIITIGATFLAGAAIAGVISSQKPQTVRLSDSTTPTAQTTSDPTTTSPDTAASATSSATVAVDPTPGGSPDSTADPTDTSTSSSGSIEAPSPQNQAQNDPAPVVTAVSAILGDWTTPVVDPDYPTRTASYRYCDYGYSDGSNKSVVYQAKYKNIANSLTATNDPFADCTLANAPAPN